MVALRTKWMTGPELVAWLSDKKICHPSQGWPMVTMLRWHAARKLVLEKGHPLPFGQEDLRIREGKATPREVTRYVIRTRSHFDGLGSVVRYRVKSKVVKEAGRGALPE